MVILLLLNDVNEIFASISYAILIRKLFFSFSSKDFFLLCYSWITLILNIQASRNLLSLVISKPSCSFVLLISPCVACHRNWLSSCVSILYSIYLNWSANTCLDASNYSSWAQYGPKQQTMLGQQHGAMFLVAFLRNIMVYPTSGLQIELM